MKASMSYEEYRQLELIPDAKSPQIKQRLGRLWQSVLTYFSSSSELQVRKAVSDGQLIWRAYDPVTGRHAEFSDELELRVWLEERYYQPSCA